MRRDTAEKDLMISPIFRILLRIPVWDRLKASSIWAATGFISALTTLALLGGCTQKPHESMLMTQSLSTNDDPIAKASTQGKIDYYENVLAEAFKALSDAKSQEKNGFIYSIVRSTEGVLWYLSIKESRASVRSNDGSRSRPPYGATIYFEKPGLGHTPSIAVHWNDQERDDLNFFPDRERLQKTGGAQAEEIASLIQKIADVSQIPAVSRIAAAVRALTMIPPTPKILLPNGEGKIVAPRANLKDFDLQGLHLVNANLEGANLRGANLQGADLRGANLRFARLAGANLAGANLQGANLGLVNHDISMKDPKMRIDLRGANLQGADLVTANLQGADLQQTNLMGANLHAANLKGADISKANLKGARLLVAELQGANLKEANLHGANLHIANLQRANLRNSDLRGAKFEGANLKEVSLGWANLQDANLQGAELQGAELRDATLGGTNLQRANLQNADLRGVNLKSASLRRANLRGANLDQASMPRLWRCLVYR